MSNWSYDRRPPSRSRLLRRPWLPLGLLVVLGLLIAFGPANARSRWHPPQALTWYWQLTGHVRNSVSARAFDIDGFDSSASEVAALHRAGKHVICYIDVGTWERWRPDAAKFPRSVLGRPNGWPGERWLDIRQMTILKPIMRARLMMCARKHFDAVEADNIDGYENGTGFRITGAQQLTYNEWVADEAHKLGLAIFEKNDPEQAPQLEPYFDGAIDEQCNQYDECSSFGRYLTAGKPVLNAEYKRSLYPGFCSADRRADIMGALYNLALDGRVYKPCPTT
ncbi:MAG: endo alpha-1,4 polygalactosaminidase [Solirubrobacteraceae bacterium]